MNRHTQKFGSVRFAHLIGIDIKSIYYYLRGRRFTRPSSHDLSSNVKLSSPHKNPKTLAVKNRRLTPLFCAGFGVSSTSKRASTLANTGRPRAFFYRCSRERVERRVTTIVYGLRTT